LKPQQGCKIQKHIKIIVLDTMANENRRTATGTCDASTT
jgi:hypothetical protein